MTRVEQHKMIQELRNYVSGMSRDDRMTFEMMLQRDKDDEDLDEMSVKKLEELSSKYMKKKSRQNAEEMWKKLTGGKK